MGSFRLTILPTSTENSENPRVENVASTFYSNINSYFIREQQTIDFFLEIIIDKE